MQSIATNWDSTIATLGLSASTKSQVYILVTASGNGSRKHRIYLDGRTVEE